MLDYSLEKNVIDFIRAPVNFMSSYIRIQNFRKVLRHALKEHVKVISHNIN